MSVTVRMPARSSGPEVLPEHASSLPPKSMSGAEPPAIEWSWNPWSECPGRASVALGFTLASPALLLVSGASGVLSVLLALAVGGTLSPLLVPSRCRVDGDGLAVRGAFGWERRGWARVRRVLHHSDGFVACPFAQAHPLDHFRAMNLPVPGSRREALLGAIRAHLDRHGL